MNEPIAFFCRAKPQGVDAFEIFNEANRVFIGYPLERNGEEYNPRQLRKCIVSPDCPLEEWERELSFQKSSRSFTQNRNLVRDVSQGSIVIVPRPEHGVVYAGRIVGPFEIINSPPWREAHLDLRSKCGEKSDDQEKWHTADVAQGWPVDKYRRIALSRIPGWLRHSMFGRSTYGRFKDHPVEDNITAFDVLGRIVEGQVLLATSWTMDKDEIARRLVDNLTANSFEHLIVSLLQLEHPDEIWQQTGGPGDGGIDGLGCDVKGNVVGLMQAKIQADSVPSLSSLGDDDRNIRRYAAVLVLSGKRAPIEGTQLLDLNWTVEAMQRNWRTLPQAMSLRVGVE